MNAPLALERDFNDRLVVYVKLCKLAVMTEVAPAAGYAASLNNSFFCSANKLMFK